MNLAAMRDQARRRCGVSSANPNADDATLAAFVNEALHTFEMEDPAGWPFMVIESQFSTVAGQAAYPHSGASGTVSGATFSKINYLEMQMPGTSYFTELERQSRQQQLVNFGSFVASQPLSWAVDSVNIYLMPAPADVWTVFVGGTATEPDLVDANDTPVYVPARFHSGIVTKTAQLLQMHLHQTAESNQLEVQYTAWVRRARASAKMYGGAGRVRYSPGRDSWGT